MCIGKTNALTLKSSVLSLFRKLVSAELYANPEEGAKQQAHCGCCYCNRNLTPQLECYRLKSNLTALSLSFSQELVRWRDV